VALLMLVVRLLCRDER